MKTTRCDKKNILPAGSRRAWAVTALTAGFLFFWLSGLGFAFADDALTTDQQKYRDYIHFQEQVAFVTEQIRQTQNDLEWLTLKVKRMQDFDRFVPQRMHDSIAFKQSRIAALKKLKQRYQDLIPELPEKHPPAENDFRTSALKENRETPETAKIGPAGETSSAVIVPLVPGGFGAGMNFRQNLEKQMAAAGLDSWLELVPNVTPVRMETRLPILFASASAQIPEGYEPFLKNLADLVRDKDVRIVVDGYADTDPIDTPSYPSNFELGAARAAAVVHALVSHGIKPQVCKIGSTGQYRFEAKKKAEWKNLQRHVTIAVFFLPTL